MTVAALVGMNRHRVVSRVATDTEGGVQDMAETGCCPMINMEVGGRSPLVLVAVQAVYRGLVRGGVGDNQLYHRAYVVVAGAATVSADSVLGQDLRKGANDVAV